MSLRFKKLHSNRLASIRHPELYRVKWDAPCRSNFQKEVKQFFKKYWAHHQCFEELPIPGTRLKCDFVNLNLKLIVESNGLQHDKYNAFFHRGSKDLFLDQLNCDAEKRAWAEHNDYRMIEIYEEDMPLTPEFIKEKFDIIL